MKDVDETGITTSGLISSERPYETSPSEYTLTTYPKESILLIKIKFTDLLSFDKIIGIFY